MATRNSTEAFLFSGSQHHRYELRQLLDQLQYPSAPPPGLRVQHTLIKQQSDVISRGGGPNRPNTAACVLSSCTASKNFCGKSPCRGRPTHKCWIVPRRSPGRYTSGSVHSRAEPGRSIKSARAPRCFNSVSPSPTPAKTPTTKESRERRQMSRELYCYENEQEKTWIIHNFQLPTDQLPAKGITGS